MKIAFVLFIVVLIDQVVKWWVRTMGWYWVLNTGGAFSIGAGKAWFPWVAVGAFVIVMLNLFQHLRDKERRLIAAAGPETSSGRQIRKLETVAWGLLIGGALSNLVDRVLWGGVIDYIAIWRLPVFNLADSGINIGVGLMLLSNFNVVYDVYMRWLKLTSSKRELLADKLMDTANLAMAGLVFGLVAEERINYVRIILGGMLYLIFMLLGYMMKK